MKFVHGRIQTGIRIRVARCVGILAIAATAVAGTQAEVLSFTGDLRTDSTFLPPGPSFTDADYAQWAAAVVPFHVGVSSAMVASTFSYGGGTNGNGTVIAEGGFEPYLSLFDASGDFLSSTFSGIICPPGTHTNTVSGFCYDVMLNGGTLAPGDYQIGISAFQNMSYAENLGTGTLSDGFTGLGNLATGEDLHYAFDVTLTSNVLVPEPTLTLPILGFFIGLAVRTKKIWPGLIALLHPN